MDNPPTPEEIKEALEIARGLIRAGVPVFAAEPVAGSPGQYHLPRQWEKTVPSEVWLDEKWKPGWGLGAVGGHVCDFLDKDPRNGGDRSIEELLRAGVNPLTFGEQDTPSGGKHWIIARTGERKSTMFMPGLDLQSGDSNGVGRGFVWIAPTIRPSKDPKDQGTLRAYRWIVPPELDALADYGQTAIDSVAGIVDRVVAKRNASRERESVLPPVTDAHAVDDPFVTAQDRAYGGDRSFTLAEAQDFVRPCLLDLRAAQIGQIEETANVAAATLSHFVPAFWSADQAMAILEDALSHTAYDPNGPSNWTAEKFRAVLDGRRPPLDAWTAERRPEPAAPPSVAVEAAPGEESLTTLERLRAKLISASDLARLPPPKPLVHGLLNLNTEAWMIGAPGSLKSFVALDLAAHVAAGKSWQGHRVEQRPVLYVAAEGETGMVLRVRAWEKDNEEMAGVTMLPYPVQVKSQDGQWDALVQISRELAPGLIVIDTQHRVSVGLEENSATDMGILISAIGRLKRATGACVLTIHHTGRAGSDARGSSALDGAQDTELKVVRAEPRAALQCKIVQDKQKDMSEGNRDGIALRFKVIDLGMDSETGRELSSLAVSDEDPFLAVEGFTPVDVDPWIGRAPGEWTKHVDGINANATLQRRILQVLNDHAYEFGLTEAAARKAVIDRWYDKGAKPDDRSWIDGWRKVASLKALAVNVGGQRWALDQVAVTALQAEHPDLE